MKAVRTVKKKLAQGEEEDIGWTLRFVLHVISSNSGKPLLLWRRRGPYGLGSRGGVGWEWKGEGGGEEFAGSRGMAGGGGSPAVGGGSGGRRGGFGGTGAAALEEGGGPASVTGAPRRRRLEKKGGEEGVGGGGWSGEGGRGLAFAVDALCQPVRLAAVRWGGGSGGLGRAARERDGRGTRGGEAGLMHLHES
uniref:Uncharacterized protein n=1 Tax=Oryza sativa subsp. japonica TaxID=39947 RepID=Q67WH7_ORYSJ|nr:hypothetical protein [Oryza sativa Japonica Group]